QAAGNQEKNPPSTKDISTPPTPQPPGPGDKVGNGKNKPDGGKAKPPDGSGSTEPPGGKPKPPDVTPPDKPPLPDPPVVKEPGWTPVPLAAPAKGEQDVGKFERNLKAPEALLQSLKDGRWRLLDVLKPQVYTGTPLVSLPGFSARVNLNSGVSLKLLGALPEE